MPHAKRDTDQPTSARVPASVPMCLRRLLTEAGAVPAGAPLEPTVERLLDFMLTLEPGAAAGLRVRVEDEELVVCRHASDPGAHVVPASERPGRERMFPDMSREQVAKLPPPLKGSLHFAAPAFEEASAETYDLLLSQAASIFALIIRVLGDRSGVAQLSPARLVQLEKLATIGQTASQIVHELNNPLTAIIAYSDFLTRRMRDRSMAESDVDRMIRISEAATRIQRFCSELTQYSRPSGSLRALVDIHGVIDRALSFCVHGLRSADIAVERIYRDVPFVLGVETALAQVFVNLITNAWHAMDGGGTLSIRTRSADGHVIVEVADEGHGIDREDAPRIFDAYFTTKQQGGGVGLGLSIVKQIVEDHGGSVGVESRDPRGTMFVLSFPPAATP